MYKACALRWEIVSVADGFKDSGWRVLGLEQFRASGVI